MFNWAKLLGLKENILTIVSFTLKDSWEICGTQLGYYADRIVNICWILKLECCAALLISNKFQGIAYSPMYLN